MNPVELHRVFRDSNAVYYLRLEVLPNKNQRFALNIGHTVDMIEMDPKTFKTRGLVPDDCEIIEYAKKLLLPLSKSVTVSPRVVPILDSIMKNEEIMKNDAEKKAHRSAKKAAPKADKKASTAAKSSKPARVAASQPSLDERFAVVVGIIKKHGDKGTIGKMVLSAELKKVYPNTYSTTKRLLAEAGKLKIDKESGAVSLAK